MREEYEDTQNKQSKAPSIDKKNNRILKKGSQYEKSIQDTDNREKKNPCIDITTEH